jgi:general secretion pathway protein D
LGRIIGLIGCTCLVIIALRMTNLQHSDHTLKGGEDRVHAGGRLSPREHYKLGKEMYLRGKYRDAVQHLDAASAATSGLTGTERRTADEYLARARTRLQDVAETRTVRAQSDPWGEDTPAKSSAPPSSGQRATPNRMEDIRHRVENLMNQAQAHLKKGDRKQARDMANLANQIAKDSQMKFAKNESPADFLARMQSPAGAAVTAAAAVPDWATDDASVGSNAKPHRTMIQQTGAEEALEETPVQHATSSGQQLSPREQAVALIAQARQDFKAGHYDEARRRALAADELEVTFDVFDDRPELVLNDIDRATSTQTFANATQPKKAASQEVAARGNAKPADGKKQQANRLLELARQDIANGNLDAAQAKVEQAAEMNVAYKLFEDMPEVVMNEIAARRAAEGIAATPNPARNPNSDAASPAKPKALALLVKARQALQEERLDEARQLAIEAERLKASYDLFDDRPDLVLTDVARTAKRGPATSGTPVSEKAPTEPANVNSAVARQNLSPAQTEAIDMLRQARQLMTAGRYDEARAKAEEAEQMNVTFPVFADRPDLVLTDLAEKMGNANVASRNPRKTRVETASGFDANDNPFAPSDEQPGRNFAVTQADSISEIAPSGSASELYARGMKELNRGNRQAAYTNFLAAHQTGQKLDYVKTQRMQDYLRELAPRTNRSGIQLTNGQVADSEPGFASDEAQPAPLDAAQQEQMVRVDRVRSDALNAIFKAERLKDKDPEAALSLIDQTMAKIEGTDLPAESTNNLMKQLTKTRSGLQSEIVRQQPNLELKKRNSDAVAAMEGSVATKVRIEQDMAKMIEEFNDLYKQQRFSEAEIIAKKLKEMNPKDGTAEALFWKARFARRKGSNDKLQLDKEESFWKQLDDVEQGVIVNVTDDHPLDFGKKKSRIDAKASTAPTIASVVRKS